MLYQLVNPKHQSQDSISHEDKDWPRILLKLVKIAIDVLPNMAILHDFKVTQEAREYLCLHLLDDKKKFEELSQSMINEKEHDGLIGHVGFIDHIFDADSILDRAKFCERVSKVNWILKPHGIRYMFKWIAEKLAE